MVKRRGTKKATTERPVDAITELTRLIPPPKAPVAARGDWAAAQAATSLRFPDDYKQVVELYGRGRFFDFLWIYSPFDQAPEWSFSNQLHISTDNLRSFKAEGFNVPFSVFPDPGGLVPFGSTENCNYLNWKTEGKPNEWSLVIWDTNYLTAWAFPDWTLAGLLLELAHHRHPMMPNGEGKLFPDDLFKASGFVAEQRGG